MEVKILSAKYLNNKKNQISVNIICEELNGAEPFTYFVSLDDRDTATLCQYLISEIELGHITIQEPDKLPDFVFASEVRYKRDSILSTTDYLIQPDYPLSEAQKDEIRKFRQLLRDISQQPGFPENVVWPIVPDCIKDKIIVEIPS